LNLNLKDIVGNIFHNEENEEETERSQRNALIQKIANRYGIEQDSYNPFLSRDGELLNPYINYQKLLDSPNISSAAKNYISKATRLSPSTNASSGTSESVQPTETTNSNQESTPTGNRIVDAAKSYMGTPYVWGGSDKSHGGMDCSGFVYASLRDAGYDVGRMDAQSYRSLGKVVDKSDMQPGDLIFYGNGNYASHIGIYVGNGQVIHSSGGSKNTRANPGRGVNIANVDHRGDFIEARRY
jgi:cell wall-associated NlpC family hydrolase